MTPIKAIREKCIDCPLHDFRMGHNPNINRRQMSEEQKNAIAERLKKAREVKE